MANYDYPFDIEWSQQEIVDVIHFFNLIEKAYETSASKSDILHGYQKFKKIVPAKSEEKRLFQDFQRSSGYSSYHVVKKAKESNQSMIKM